MCNGVGVHLCTKIERRGSGRCLSVEVLECVVVGRVVVVVVTAARQFVHNSRRGVFQYVFLKVFLTMVTLFLQVSSAVRCVFTAMGR